jgi:hypothetical protein
MVQVAHAAALVMTEIRRGCEDRKRYNKSREVSPNAIAGYHRSSLWFPACPLVSNSPYFHVHVHDLQQLVVSNHHWECFERNNTVYSMMYLYHPSLL